MRKTLQAFRVDNVATTVLIDLHGYDMFPSLASLEAGPLKYKHIFKQHVVVSVACSQETTSGNRTLCASCILDRAPDVLRQRVANRIYEDARQGALQIGGFPDYSPLVHALQNVVAQPSSDSYQVTVKKHDRLVILKALAEKWLESDEFGLTARKLIEEHNQYYNTDGEWWEEPAAETRCRPINQLYTSIIQSFHPLPASSTTFAGKMIPLTDLASASSLRPVSWLQNPMW